MHKKNVRNKEKSLRKINSFIIAVSVGIVIMGMGLLFIGVSGVWSRSDYQITDDYLSKNKSKKIIEEETKTKEVTEEGTYVINDRAYEILYPIYPVEGDNIGSLIIPALEMELPIFQGTTENELKKGVGHFMESVLPGEKDNSVLSGHRETVFRKLGDLVVGDILVLRTSAGIFTYIVSSTRIVEKDDRTVIVPTDHAVLTLTTCYPFNYVGSAPSRYIVSTDLVVEK